MSIPIVSFAASFFLLAVFVVFKALQHNRSELKTYTKLRERADALVLRFLYWLKHRLVQLGEHLSLGNIIRVALHHGASGVARTAQKVESHARDVSMKVSRSSHRARDTRSSYLSEVETHKNGLDTERVRRETRLAPEEREE